MTWTILGQAHRRIALALALASALLTCRQTDGVGSADLLVSPVDVDYRVSGDSLPLPAYATDASAEVAVFWRDKARNGERQADGSWLFSGVRPSADETAAIRVFSPGRPPLIVWGWSHASATLPTTFSQVVTQDGSQTSDDVAVFRFEVSDWTPSGIDESSEAVFAQRHAGNIQPASAFNQISDVYVQSGLGFGQGERVCSCRDAAIAACLADAETPDACDACPSVDLICLDPNGFGGGPTGATLILPLGVNDFGFVERITNYETGQFIEIGRAYLQQNFAVESTAERQLTIAPDIAPDLALCPGDGLFNWVLAGLPRSFVLSETGGVRIHLALVSETGLRLPILRNEHWPSRQVLPLGSNDQQIRFGYPHRLQDRLANFTYDYAVTAEAQHDQARYSIAVRGRASAEDLCNLRLKFQPAGQEFLRPVSDVASGLDVAWTNADKRIIWLGETAPLRLLQIFDASGQAKLNVWLLDPTLFELDLTADWLDEWRLPPGYYRLRLTHLQPTRAQFDAAALLDAEIALDDWRPTAASQTHVFKVAE